MRARRRQNHFLVECPCCERMASFITEPSPRSFFEALAWIEWKRTIEAGLHIHLNEDLQTCDNCDQPSDGFLIVVDRTKREATETLPKCEACKEVWKEENTPKKY